jgi:2,4-dienoyl-CoA reductase-like NADH-dependent reductase (Old Yellow Enzyme family)/thioredoxin reductase
MKRSRRDTLASEAACEWIPALKEQEHERRELMKAFPRLFEPGEMGGLSIRNRLVRASMWTAYGARDGSVSERVIRHYREIARGGTGLVNVEFCHVDNKSSKSNLCQLSIADDEYIPGLALLASTIKENGAAAGIQISHAGGQRYLPFPPRKVPSLLAWISSRGKSPLPVEEITTAEIEELVETFGNGALRAKRAGFDLVEVHACHGYLITSFLSALTNSRTDPYGGSFENRNRFLMEILQNVRRKIGPDFPLAVRIDGSEYLEGGITIEETLETVRILEKAGVNVLHVSGGTHKNVDKMSSPSYWPLGYQVWAAEKIKKVVGVPVIASGSITSPQLAEEILEQGKADFISLARPLLADPHFAKKAREGRPEDITPCIRCNVGCQTRPEGAVSCAVNVLAGNEDESRFQKAERKRNVVVVGGGPAGMEAARTAAMMGHDVTLFEKRRLGGMLLEASIPEFKADLRALVQYLATQVQKLGVRVILQEADTETIRRSGADAVILASGADPVVADLPGIHGEKTVGALEVLNGAKVGREVLVIGGGLVGCEVALYLAEQKKRVTIIEMLDQLLPEMDVLSANLAFFERFHRQDVRVMTGTRLLEVTGDGVVVSDKEGKKSCVKGDTVVAALGLRANRKLYQELSSLPGLEVYPVGDCREPRKIYQAIHEGHFAARNL